MSAHATEVDVDAVARRAQQLIADKLEELNAALPLVAASEASSGGSTPQARTASALGVPCKLHQPPCSPGREATASMP